MHLGFEDESLATKNLWCNEYQIIVPKGCIVFCDYDDLLGPFPLQISEICFSSTYLTILQCKSHNSRVLMNFILSKWLTLVLTEIRV